MDSIIQFNRRSSFVRPSSFCLPSSCALHPSSFVIRHSSFVIRHWSFVLRSSFVLRPSFVVAGRWSLVWSLVRVVTGVVIDGEGGVRDVGAAVAVAVRGWGDRRQEDTQLLALSSLTVTLSLTHCHSLTHCSSAACGIILTRHFYDLYELRTANNSNCDLFLLSYGRYYAALRLVLSFWSLSFRARRTYLRACGLLVGGAWS